jgi:predicted TIM-barrel fold metal-dependent hydrolase
MPTLVALALLGVVASLASFTLVRSARGGTQSDGESPFEGAAPALSPFVDVHVHLDPRNPGRAIEAASQAMARENAAKIFFMPPPFTTDDPTRYEADTVMSAREAHANKLAFLGGGGTLNAMIHDSVQSGAAGPEVRQRFKERAEDLLRSGAEGFGELAAEHLQGATRYQSAPPDHPLFLLLADIAAEHGVPIDLHMEAVPHDMPLPAGQKSPPNPPRLRANLDAFERLLAHNPRARIIWAHAGWDNTGYRTPELCRRLLKAHPNLYMDVKIDPARPGLNSPFVNGSSGAIKPEWLRLFQDFPDRFVVGSDQHYPEPLPGAQRWEAVVLLLNHLPKELKRKIGAENAARLYPGRGRDSSAP